MLLFVPLNSLRLSAPLLLMSRGARRRFDGEGRRWRACDWTEEVDRAGGSWAIAFIIARS